MMTFKTIEESLSHLSDTGAKSQSYILPKLTQEFLKDANYYVPKDEGLLERSSIVNSDVEKGLVKWATPYAAKLFHGYNYRFSKDANPNATYEWAEKARLRNKEKYKKMIVKLFKELL